jgi:hypothetical protein
MRIGRAADNDVVVPAPVISLYHAEIYRDDRGLRIRDLGSTNGTFVDEARIEDAALLGQETIRLGAGGPDFGLTSDESMEPELDRTLVLKRAKDSAPAAASAGAHEAMLSEAVEQARRARVEGMGGETLRLMREVVDRALRRNRWRSRLVIACLAAALVATAGFAWWRISGLNAEQAAIDRQIRDVDERLAKVGENPQEADRLIAEITSYQSRAETLRHSLLYSLARRRPEDFVTAEIRRLMAEFGAEVYAIPPEFVTRVNHYIEQYRGPDRPLMEKALGEYGDKVEVMREALEREQMPPDLAYVPLVESAFDGKTSAAGAAGPWQFTLATAKAYGLRVDGRVDERLNLRASTRAASRYLRELILDFGSGSSVMLALAAYNIGPGKVKQAIARTVEDPIKQRNFWYLYRARALPAETREYVPKVFAAILIGRNPERFGFK